MTPEERAARRAEVQARHPAQQARAARRAEVQAGHPAQQAPMPEAPRRVSGVRGMGLEQFRQRRDYLKGLSPEQREGAETTSDKVAEGVIEGGKGAIDRGATLGYQIWDRLIPGEQFKEQQQYMKEKNAAAPKSLSRDAGGMLLEEIATAPVSAIGHMIRMPRYAQVLARSAAGRKLTAAFTELGKAKNRVVESSKFAKARTPELKKIMKTEATKNEARRVKDLKAAQKEFKDYLAIERPGGKLAHGNDAESIGWRLMGDTTTPGYLDKQHAIKKAMEARGDVDKFAELNLKHLDTFGGNYSDALKFELPMHTKIKTAEDRLSSAKVLKGYDGLPPAGSGVKNNVPGLIARKAEDELGRINNTMNTSGRRLHKATGDWTTAQAAKQAARVTKGANLASSGIARGGLEGAATGFLFGEDPESGALAGGMMGAVAGGIPDALRVGTAGRHKAVESGVTRAAKKSRGQSVLEAKFNRTVNRALGHDSLTNRIPYSATQLFDSKGEVDIPLLKALLKNTEGAKNAFDPTDPKFQKTAEIANLLKNSAIREALEEEEE